MYHVYIESAGHQNFLVMDLTLSRIAHVIGRLSQFTLSPIYLNCHSRLQSTVLDSYTRQGLLVSRLFPLSLQIRSQFKIPDESAIRFIRSSMGDGLLLQ